MTDFLVRRSATFSPCHEGTVERLLKIYGFPGRLIARVSGCPRLHPSYERIPIVTAAKALRRVEACSRGRTAPHTLAYDRLVRYVQRSGLTLDELVTRYLNVAILVQPSDVPRIIANDADDDQVLACALEAQADLIVSGDHHLIDLNTYHGIPIVKAAEALRRVETQK